MTTDLTSYLSRSVKKIFATLWLSSLFDPKQRSFLRTVTKNTEEAAAKRKAAGTRGEHIPVFLIAAITRRCNLRCKGCYDRANAEKTVSCGDDLSAQRWGELFEEAANLGVSFILLAGGEPFLRRDVLQAAGECPRLLFPIFSNGTLIDEKGVTLLKRYPNLIPFISVEGDADVTDARRGSGIFAAVTTAMTALKRERVIFGVSVTVTTANRHAVTDTAFLRRLVAGGTRAVIYIEYESMSAADADLCFDDTLRAEFLSRLAALRKDLPDLLFLAFPGDEAATGGCLAAGRGFFYINADGAASPCPFSPYGDHSLATGSLKAALNSDFFVRLRNSGILTATHDGSCVLHAHEDEVKSLLKEGSHG